MMMPSMMMGKKSKSKTILNLTHFLKNGNLLENIDYLIYRNWVNS